MAAVAQLKLTMGAQATEVLRRAGEIVRHPAKLHAAIAHTMVSGGGKAIGVQRHIMAAAKTRHKTADALGAKRTGYLEKAAQNIEAKGTTHGARIIINNSSGIFARTFKPVTVRPGNGKQWLAIPVHKAAYGKSPLNFQDRLDFVKVNDGLALWFLRDQPKADQPKTKANKPAKPTKAAKVKKSKPAATAAEKPKRQLMFIGKRQVTLPKDRGLLPSDEDFRELIKAGADAAVQSELEDLQTRWPELAGAHPPTHRHV